MKKRTMSFLLAVIMLVSLISPVQAFGASSFTVTCNGETVESVVLPKYDNVELNAEGAAAYQWQIKAGDVWANISGETGATLKLTYAMVAGLLTDGSVLVRCKDASAENVYSQEVKVTVDETAPVFEKQPQATEAPVATEVPEATEAPVATEVPETTEAPVATEVPEATEVPVATEAPEEVAPELVAAVEAAQAEADKTTADLAAAEQLLADAQTAAENARAELEAAQQAAQAAPAEVTLEEAAAPEEAAPEAEAAAPEAAASEEAAAEPEAAAPEEVAPEAAESTVTEAPAAPAQEEVAAKQAALDAALAELENAQAAYDAAKTAADEAAQVLADAKAALQQAEADAAASPAQPVAPAPAPAAPEASAPEAPAPEADDPELKTYVVEIKYQFEDGKQAANPWTATVAEGSDLQQTVPSPEVVGYKPDRSEVTIDVTDIRQNIVEVVTYKPDIVNYTVQHLWQNTEDDGYTVHDTETMQGLTGSTVPEGLAKTDGEYDGFISLLYDPEIKIAADGSTVVEIKYDRPYYLITFDLDGGYGLEPIYARFGAEIKVDTSGLTKPGYRFSRFTPELPATMPKGGGTYTAQWMTDGNVNFTVVFWYENAEDDGYSYAGSVTRTGTAGQSVRASDYRDTQFDGKDATHFTYEATNPENKSVSIAGDGSTVLNVYFSRNEYTLTFKSGTGSRAETYGTITAKYQASIADKWPVPGEKMSNGDVAIPNKLNYWSWGNEKRQATKIFSMTDEVCKGSGTTFVAVTNNNLDTYTINYWLESLDGTGTSNDGTKYQKSEKFSQTLNYSSGQKTWGYKQIDGFDAQYDTAYREGNSWNGYYFNLYYKRNRNDITFLDGYGTTVATVKDIMFEMPLNKVEYHNQLISQIKPDYPDGLEPGAYKFGGWYTTAGCYDGTEADFEKGTMPNAPLVFYAKWVPITHKVTFYKDSTLSEQLGATYDIPHGKTIKEMGEEAPKATNGEYEFVGWFYTADDGSEKPFDVDNMPVNRDLKLYAKWRSNALVQYIIHYVDENDVAIADDTRGNALAGTTKTFDAKVGADLFEEYQEGYFPETKSHSIDFDLNKVPESGIFEYTFEYVAKDKVPYTVKYLEEGTEKILYKEKSAESSSAIVTENYVPISGYMPKDFQIRLVLSAEGENVITFWYNKDDVHAPVQVVHYTQNIDGDGYTMYRQLPDVVGTIGTDFSTDVLTIPGFSFAKVTANGVKVEQANNKVTVTVTEKGLLLELYYNRIEYPYEFRYLKQGTNEELAEPEMGMARYQATVSGNAKNIPGYELAPGETNPKTMTIQIEEDTTTAVNNVKPFYYVEQQATIDYEVVGDGKVSLENEKIKVFNGTPEGSTPTADDGYRFVGWFLDKDCNNPVKADWVDGNNHITPDKTKDYGSGNMGYESMTLYAKFERNEVYLTITTMGTADIDENQGHAFTVTVDPADESAPFTFEVAICEDGSETFKVPYGTYTVTENDPWNWRYSGHNDVTLDPVLDAKGKLTATATFDYSSGRNKIKWLNGCSFWQSNN